MYVDQKKLVGCVAFFLCFFVASLTQTEARPDKRYDAGTQMCRVFTFKTLWAGYKTFRNNCKSCHTHDNQVNAPFLYTESKTSKGWNVVFEKKYPGCAQQGVWDTLSLEEILKLNDYLYANGLGSYDANTDCG